MKLVKFLKSEFLSFDLRSKILLGLSLLALIVPPLITRVLPLTDLEGFVHLNGFPAHRSFGPEHYYLFQLTYIVHHVFFRIMSLLSLSAGVQSHIAFYIQIFVFFTSNVLILKRISNSKLTLALGITLFSFGIYEGFFLWGGPFAFSLMAYLFIGWIYYNMFTDQPRIYYPIVTPILLTMIHPHAIIFIFIYLLAVFVVYKSVEIKNILAASITCCLMGYLISREHPLGESSILHFSIGQTLVEPHLSLQILWDRCRSLFSFDALAVRQLYHSKLSFLETYWIVCDFIRILGWVGSLLILFNGVKSKNNSLKVCAAFTLFAVIYYFIHPLSFPVNAWYLRILLVVRGPSLLLGIYFIQSLSMSRIINFSEKIKNRIQPYAIGVCVLVICLLTSDNFKLMNFGNKIEEAYFELKRQIEPISGPAFITQINWENLSPHSMRIVPFLLFDDPDLVRKNIYTHSEWHRDLQHNSRINYYAMVRSDRKSFILNYLPQELPWKMRYELRAGVR